MGIIKKLNIVHIVLILMATYFIKDVLISFYDNTRLGQKGIPHKAVISPEKYLGARRHGPGKYYYSFEVNGVIYKGNTEKEEGVFVSDTIDIFYLSSDPTINCSYEYAKGIFFQQLIED